MEPTQLATCERLHTHDREEPAEMTTWRTWAREMSRTHTQHRCPRCSQFKIWLPRRSSDNAMLATFAARPAS